MGMLKNCAFSHLMSCKVASLHTLRARNGRLAVGSRYRMFGTRYARILEKFDRTGWGKSINQPGKCSKFCTVLRITPALR